MNRIYLALAVLILIPALSGFYLFYTETKCDELAEMIEYASENYAEGEVFEKAKEKWDKIETVLAISANHSVVDHINESFAKAEAWLKLDDENMFIAELKCLERLVRHISETERPTVYNIF